MMFGLGAWPSDPYYDPNRPWWLPYWIDDTTESQNKVALAVASALPGGALVAPLIATGPSQKTADSQSAYSLPPAPPTVQPPSMVTDPTGQTVDPTQQSQAQAQAEQQQLVNWAAQQSQQTPVDNTSAGAIANCWAESQGIADYLNCLGGKPPGTPGLPSWVWIAGFGVVMILVLKK